MRVKVLISFVGTVGERKYRLRAGDELTLPEGADWVRAGLAEPVDPEPIPPEETVRGAGAPAPDKPAPKRKNKKADA